MKVLVTDAGYKHALGAIRSLGQKHIHVIAGSSSRYALSFFSKYCRERVLYPDPRNEESFVKFVLRYVIDNKVDVILPIGYLTTTVLSKYKNEFRPYTKLPISDWDSMKIACNKAKTIEFCRGLGIPLPESYTEPQQVESFPVVVKNAKGTGQVRYVNSHEELLRSLTQDSLIQEYIPGEGYGFFALRSESGVKAVFMHKRIREYPITGGSSTAAESVYDAKLQDLGLRILNSLGWYGVAMVEFKKDDRDGQFKLMEINAKFWGSLDLAIASGVDFPYLAVKMAIGEEQQPVLQYQVGTRFRWLFPDDILHLVAKPSSVGAFVTDFFNHKTKSNLWLNDIKPNLLQLIMTFPIVIFRIKNKILRYPHGIPKGTA